MNNNDQEIIALKARMELLEKQVVELTTLRPITDRRLSNLHKAFMAISGEVIEINGRLKAVLQTVFPGVAPTMAEVNRIIRPDETDDGSREPPNS